MKILSEEIYSFLENIVEKPLGPWKSRKEIDGVLRRRLTKKEYKLLTAIVEKAELPPLLEKLHLDKERCRSLEESLRKKLNRDIIKRELCEVSP